MNSSILREYFVRIGFDVDQSTYKDFQAKFKTTVEQFEKLAKVTAVAVASMAAVGGAILETASKMEGLYFAAQRAGTSVASLMAIRFGGEQAGVGADAIASAVERMSSAIRTNPGMRTFFDHLGVLFQPGQGAENFKNLIVALSELNKQNPILARQFGQALGIDEQMLNTLFKNMPDFLRGMQQQADALKRSGIDADALAKRSHEAAENWRNFLVHVDTLVMLFEQHMLPFLDKVVVFLIRAVDEMVALDHATQGWSTRIGGVLAIVGSLLGGLKIISMLLGLGGGAAAAGGAGAGAAGAAGSASGAWNAAAAGGGIASGIATGGLAAIDALLAYHDVKAGTDLYRTYRDSGAFKEWGNSLKTMISHFEGFSNKVYRDISGKPTIGYGHKLLPGETFAGGVTQEGANRLLMQDMAAAHDVVTRLVKVALNANQMAALTDFVYNVGSGNFAGSTLLKMLNMGNFSGAAGQFAQWNRAGGAISSDLTQRRADERDMFQRPVTMDQETNIHVYGNNDPAATSREVANQQRLVNGDLLRNMGTTVQ